MGQYFSGIDLSFPLNKLMKTVDKYRIESALVCSGEANLDKETRRILRALRNNRKLYALLRTDPTNYKLTECVKSTERLLRQNDRVIGLKVNPSTEKCRITDDVYKTALETLSDHSGVLLLHCGRWLEMSGWHYGIEIAKRYPKIKVILAHMGGTHPDLSFPAIEAAKPLANVWMDTSQTRQIVVLKKGIEKLGAERMLFGSDMPWGDYLQNLVGIIQLNLNESKLNKILKENFRTIIMKE